MGEEAVTRSQVDHTTTTKEAPDAPRHLPRFVQLLARKTPGVADGTPDAMKEGLTREAIDVPVRQPAAGRVREHG
jgi:hypothetical protein